MNKNDIIEFSKNIKFLFNKDQVIILNRLNGQWIKISNEVFEILKSSESEKLSMLSLLDLLADDEDRVYITQLINNLNEMGCVNYNHEKEIDSISLAITHRCNLKCVHCMVDAKDINVGDYYSTKELKHFINKIVEVNPKNIVITGGEPMLRSDFFEIIQYLKEIYNGKISLMTNGTLFTENNIPQIIKLVDSIDISMDGADEESCAIVRGRGVFGKVTNNIKLLKHYGFSKIHLSMVLTNNNSNYVDDFYRLNEELGTKPMLRALSFEGRAEQNKDLLESQNTRTLKHNDVVKTEDSVVNIRGCCCTAGYDQLTIEANGDIFPCNLFVEEKFKLGSISKINSINDVFNDKDCKFLTECIESYEPDKFEKCKHCNVNYFCWSCIYPMYKLSNEEFDERCEYKKSVLAKVWE